MLQVPETRLLRSLSGPVVAADQSGRILFFNEPASLLLGWDGGDLVGAPLEKIMPERMRPLHEQGFRRYVRTGESRLLGHPVRVPALHKDGHEVEVDLQIFLFRRSDGHDLIVATLEAAQEGSPAGLQRLGEVRGKPARRR